MDAASIFVFERNGMQINGIFNYAPSFVLFVRRILSSGQPFYEAKCWAERNRRPQSYQADPYIVEVRGTSAGTKSKNGKISTGEYVESDCFPCETCIAAVSELRLL